MKISHDPQNVISLTRFDNDNVKGKENDWQRYLKYGASILITIGATFETLAYFELKKQKNSTKNKRKR